MSNKLIYYLKKYKKNSIYFQGFIKTISVFLLSLIILGGLIHATSYKIIERLINESNRQSLNQIMKEIDANIDISVGLLIQFASNEYFQLNPAAPLHDKVEFTRQFSIPFNAKKFIDSIYVFSPQNDEMAVVSYNDVGITTLNDLGDASWLSYYNDHPPVSNYPVITGNRNIKRGIGSISALTLMMKYPLSGEESGYVVINIDKKKLFENISVTENEKYYVINEKNEIIFGDESFYENENIKNIINNHDRHKPSLIITSDISAITNFKYIKVYNTTSHLQETNKLFFIEILIFLVCSLVGLFELSRITFRTYNPLLEIGDKFSKLVKTGSEKNEIDLINKVVNQVLSDKNTFESLYLESASDILKGLMLRIISGEHFSEKYIFKQLANFGISQENNSFVIVIVRLNGYDVITQEFSNDDLASIREVTENMFDTASIAVSYIKEDTLMIILGGFDRKKTNEKCEILYNKLKEKFDLSTTIGIGNEVSSITELSSSYFSAVSALNIAFFTDSPIQDGAQAEASNEEYTYPTAMEWSLVVAVKKGDLEEAVRIIDDIYKSIPKTPLMAEYAGDIFWQLLNGIFVSLTTINIKYENIMSCHVFDTHQIFKKLDTASSIVNFTKEIIFNITNYIKNEKTNNDSILNAAKEYINQNYYDPALSQKQVAKTINFSPSYFSLLIKDILGESFRDYLLRIRMENAIKLLLETKLPVAAISTKVGYENTRSFLRAFKAYTGFTPTDYRKQNIDLKQGR